jgi:hypothetical protein
MVIRYLIENLPLQEEKGLRKRLTGYHAGLPLSRKKCVPPLSARPWYTLSAEPPSSKI